MPTQRSHDLGRRRLVAGAAWTVPAMTVVAAAPAHAVSPADCSLYVTPGDLFSGVSTFDLVNTGPDLSAGATITVVVRDTCQAITGDTTPFYPVVSGGTVSPDSSLSCGGDSSECVTCDPLRVFTWTLPALASGDALRFLFTLTDPNGGLPPGPISGGWFGITVSGDCGAATVADAPVFE